MAFGDNLSHFVPPAAVQSGIFFRARVGHAKIAITITPAFLGHPDSPPTKIVPIGSFSLHKGIHASDDCNMETVGGRTKQSILETVDARRVARHSNGLPI